MLVCLRLFLLFILGHRAFVWLTIGRVYKRECHRTMRQIQQLGFKALVIKQGIHPSHELQY